MDQAMMGWIGGIAGSAIGIAGGVFGTWCSIRNAQSQQERRFVIRWAVYFWLGCSAFLALLFVTPNPYRWFFWIPYSFVLVWAIKKCNEGQARIRASAGEQHADSRTSA